MSGRGGKSSGGNGEAPRDQLQQNGKAGRSRKAPQSWVTAESSVRERNTKCHRLPGDGGKGGAR